MPGNPTAIAQSSRPTSIPSSSASVADDAEELAGDEVAPRSPALLGGVARAIGREPARQVGASGRLERLAGDPEDELDAWRLLHEADRPQARGRERREQARGLGERRARSPVSASSSGRLPERDLRGARGAPVLRDDLTSRPGQRARQLGRVPDRRRGEQERRRRSVQGADAAQPPQDERHVAAEDTPVDVCLVDDDVREAAEHLGPARVVREDPEVQHVRVREDRVAPTARERSSLRVACRRRRASASDRAAAPTAAAPGPARAPSSG